MHISPFSLAPASKGARGARRGRHISRGQLRRNGAASCWDRENRELPVLRLLLPCYLPVKPELSPCYPPVPRAVACGASF